MVWAGNERRCITGLSLLLSSMSRDAAAGYCGDNCRLLSRSRFGRQKRSTASHCDVLSYGVCRVEFCRICRDRMGTGNVEWGMKKCGGVGSSDSSIHCSPRFLMPTFDFAPLRGPHRSGAKVGGQKSWLSTLGPRNLEGFLPTRALPGDRLLIFSQNVDRRKSRRRSDAQRDSGQADEQSAAKVR